jgi:hypothetical protein
MTLDNPRPVTEETFRTVEAPTIGGRKSPSRDHGHLIDGNLFLDSFRARIGEGESGPILVIKATV